MQGLHSTLNRPRLGLGLLALLTGLAWTTPADAAEIGADGGISLTVSFETDPDIASSQLARVDDPGAQAHYCGAVDQFSEELYALTEGKHWIRQVRFYEQTQYSDLRWRYITDPDDYTFSYGSFQDWILVNEKGTLDDDPYASPPHSINGLAWLLNHEFGHFFYGLPDEYVYRDAGTGRTGFCADGSYGQFYDEDDDLIGDGTNCDEEALLCGGTSCVFFFQCISGDEDPGTACAADEDCIGGTCLGADEERSDIPEKKRICLAETDLSIDTGQPELGVCIMAGGGQRDRWCDGNHVYTFEDRQFHGFDVEFDLGYEIGPEAEWDDYSCWDAAAAVHADLAGAHDEGVYPSLADIEAEVGPRPPVDCEWRIDGAGDGAHALLLVDRSGSMSTPDEGGATALDLALDAALYFYNETDNSDYVGISVYNDVVAHAESGGDALVFQQKTTDIDTIGGLNPGGDTDIAKAFDTARLEILGAGAPEANRNIVLFSDGKHNGGGNPFAEADQACEDGITVHTISYGDADSDALAQMECSGQSWVTGTIENNGLDWGMPDPVEIKSAIARLQHHVSDEDEITERIANLEPIAQSIVETMTFTVPEDTPMLTFSWLANHACVLIFDEGGEYCEPVLNLLERVELEDPSGRTYPTGVSRAEQSGVYRSRSIRNPEPGEWIARIDKSEPPIPGMFPGLWEANVPETRIAWVAFVDHPSLDARAWTSPRRAPVDHPVGIRARMHFRSLATNISVDATVTHTGLSWAVPLFDDGEHGDGEPHDGLYGGWFNPDGDWPDVEDGNYRVKVHFASQAGIALGVGPADTSDDDVALRPTLRPGTAVLEAETSFRLSDRYTHKRNGDPNPGSISFTCPDLERNASTPLSATLIGMAADAANARVVLGADVELDSLVFSCLNCADTQSDPITQITFEATPDGDATLGFRPLRVQIGHEIVESNQLCRICAAGGTCDEIELDQEPLQAQATSALTATGAQPGETVRFAASPKGLGNGPCPPLLGGLCLDLGMPAFQIGTAVADEFGRAVFALLVPNRPQVEVGTQAVIARGRGGADSVKSQPILDRIDP